MPTDFILPTGNWITLDLYSEETLSVDNQIKNLDIIRQKIRSHIINNREDGYLYSVDMKLFPDIENSHVYRLYVDINAIPVNKFDPVGSDFDLGNGGDRLDPALSGTGHTPPTPVPPRGIAFGTAFKPIFYGFRSPTCLGAVVGMPSQA